jgi:outer membrane lipoprotein-sorting protein
MKKASLSAALALSICILAGTRLAAQQAKEPQSISPMPPARPATMRPASSAATPATPATAPTPVSPAASAPVPTIDQANAYLNSLTQLTGNFVQIGPDGKRNSGKLYVLRPGKLRFEYDPPSPLEIVADGKSVILRDRKLATQDLYSLGQTPLKFLLESRIDLRRDAAVKFAKLEGDNFIVVIEDRSTFGGTSRIALTFDAKVTALRRWVVTDPQGYDTSVTLSDLNTAKRPDNKLFVIDYQRVL